MPTAESSPTPLPLTPKRIASATAVLVGLALASYGGYTQYTISSALARGACDGCAPWHPLFVVAPLVLGIALVAAGSYAFAKTTC
jgi:hypothetical protein